MINFENPKLIECIQGINPPDDNAMEEARERQNYLAKVPGSLGSLEDISIRLAGITGKNVGNDVSNQAIILMCSDNGVVEEGVASAPQSVTLMQTVNFTKGITGVSSQAKHFGIDLLVVDVGVKLPIPSERYTDQMVPGKNKVVNRRIAKGTRNLAKEPAMTKAEAEEAISIGIEAADACVKNGKTLIGIGEMGIGNTTTASAIITALVMEKEPQDIEALVEKIVGRGGGLNDEGLSKKRRVIKGAVEKHRDSCADTHNPIDLLCNLGGFDIAAMAGAYLGAAANKTPVVIDGLISIAAALVAREICPETKAYMFCSHKSREGGYALASDLLGLEPMYDLGMRLGEGSGCPIAFKIIEAAVAVMNNMKTLDEAQIDSGYLDEFREDGQFQ